MAEFSFQEVMRTGHVKRWQIVRTAREQTLAEHLYRTWVITRFICTSLEVDQYTATTAHEWALVHDQPEVITGDIATPAKEAMRKAVPDSDPIKNIELELSESYALTWQASKLHVVPGWPTPYEIVKLADIMEAAVFLGTEGVGTHSRIVYEGIRRRVAETYADYRNRYPEVPWDKIRHLINDSWMRT